MSMASIGININIRPGGIPPRIHVSQYDDDSRIIILTLYNGTSRYMPQNVTAAIRGTKPDGKGFSYGVSEGVTYASGEVEFNIKQQMTAVAGDVVCEAVLFKNDAVLGTANFILDVEKAALGEDADISETEIPAIIDAATASAEAAAESASEALASATAAATSETNAATSATNASNSASAAATSASNASTSETNAASSATSAGNSATAAGNSATSAETSALTAEAWAVGKKNGTDVPSTDPQYENNAKYWSDLAATYAAQLGSAVKWRGSILFAGLPTTGMQNGDFYDIKDAFTTDNRFIEGAGVECPAGTDVVWSGDDSKWNIMTPSGVNSFNGRRGAVTPAANDYSATQITSNVVIGGETKTNVADALQALANGGSETAEYRYNIVTKSTSGTNATVTVNKYVDNSLESSTDYRYSSVTTPANIDGRFTLGYSNATHKFTMTLVVNSTTHAGGYEESWLFSETVDFSEVFVDSANDITYIAPTFTTSTAYNVGDLVTYEGRFYKCTTAHPAGTWNISHFTPTNVDAEFVKDNDNRLSDARPASDVSAWAKASTKPSYTASEVGALPVNGKANTAGTADKVAHHLTIGSINTIDFDGSVAGGVDMWNLVCPLTASGWSALTDADGFYTQDIYPTYNGNTAYFDMDKPVIITIASAPNNQRPTSAEQAAYNMIDPTWYYPDSGTRYFRFYTKTKPTTDFYVRIMGFSVYNTI